MYGIPVETTLMKSRFGKLVSCKFMSYYTLTSSFNSRKCDCCQRGFQRWMPHIKEKNTFMQGGQNVAIKRNNEVRIVPLCNGCITLYYERGWLAVKK
jgi:hypothetical protein